MSAVSKSKVWKRFQLHEKTSADEIYLSLIEFLMTFVSELKCKFHSSEYFIYCFTLNSWNRTIYKWTPNKYLPNKLYHKHFSISLKIINTLRLYDHLFYLFFTYYLVNSLSLYLWICFYLVENLPSGFIKSELLRTWKKLFASVIYTTASKEYHLLGEAIRLF